MGGYLLKLIFTSVATSLIFISFSCSASAANPIISSKHKVEGTKIKLSGQIQMENLDICNRDDGFFCAEFIAKPFEASLTCEGGGKSGGWIESEIFNIEETEYGSKNLQTRSCGSLLKICYRHESDDSCVYIINDKDPPPNIIQPVLTASVDSSLHIKSLKGSKDFSQCGASSSIIHKQYCVWSTELSSANVVASDLSGNEITDHRLSVHDKSGTISSGFTGNTGDDMFRISPGAKGFLEYIDIPESNPDRLRYISRDNSVPHDMMIPAGPKNSLTDFNIFVNNPPKSAGISVKKACFPTKAEVICDFRFTEIPPIDGKCGSAHKQSGISNIPQSAYCKMSEPKNIVSTGTKTTWECPGYEGGKTAECYASHIVDGQCGSADGLTNVSSMSKISSESLCLYGEMIDFDEKANSFTWSCLGENNGNTASCKALKPGPSECIYKVQSPDDMKWVSTSHNRFYIGAVGNNYWRSSGKCTLFEREIEFYVEDVTKIDEFYFDEQGFDDIMGVYINDKEVWKSRALPKLPASCELSTSWKLNNHVDALPYLKTGYNKIRFSTYVQGAGEGWVQGYIQDNCSN